VHQRVDAGDGDGAHPLQREAALLLAADLDVGLGHLLERHLAVLRRRPVQRLGVLAELGETLQRLLVYRQGPADQVVVVECRHRALDELQAHVAHVLARGPRLGQGVLAAQLTLPRPGVLL
jgi:hypothetical protein